MSTNQSKDVFFEMPEMFEGGGLMTQTERLHEWARMYIGRLMKCRGTQSTVIGYALSQNGLGAWFYLESSGKVYRQYPICNRHKK